MVMTKIPWSTYQRISLAVNWSNTTLVYVKPLETSKTNVANRVDVSLSGH